MLNILELMQLLLPVKSVIAWLVIGLLIAIYRGNPAEIVFAGIFLGAVILYKRFNKEEDDENAFWTVLAIFIAIGALFGIFYLGSKQL